MKKLIPILQILIYITYVAELTPFLLCLIFFKKITSPELKVFFLYTIVVAFFLCLSFYFKFITSNGVLRLFANRFFLVAEFSLLSFFYYTSLSNKRIKLIFRISVILFFFYSIYDYIVTKPGDFSFVPLVIECLYFLLVILYFFYYKIQNNSNTSIYIQPVFWISVGFLIYFSGNFFLFLFSSSMINNPAFRLQYTIIYDSVTIIKNIFICTAIIVNAKNDDQISNPTKNINIDLDTDYLLNKNTNL